ncbi:MAG: hypothetical protein NTW87_25210 [Planctomycetota bacterium]|nr:hypothetical protein [Planctomycetota bacterium]
MSSGRTSIQFGDVPATLDPYSVRLTATDGKRLDVLEQNYDYDLYSSGILLDRAIGRDVEAVYPDGTSVTGTLLSFDYGVEEHYGNEVNWREDVHSFGDYGQYPGEPPPKEYGGHYRPFGRGELIQEYWCRILLRTRPGELRILTVNDLADLRFVCPPADLREEPRLTWEIDNRAGPRRELELSYLAGGIQWRADYVLRVDAAGARASLAAALSLKNETGADLRDATVKVVTGEVELRPEVTQPRVVVITMKKGRRLRFLFPFTEGPGEPEFPEEVKKNEYLRQGQLFEYHTYEILRPVTLRNNETKNVELFGPKRILSLGPVHLEYDPGRAPQDVRRRTELVNSKANGLGIPLPAGRIEVWRQASPEGQTPVSAESIPATPVDEKIPVDLGRDETLSCRCTGPMEDTDNGRAARRWFYEIRNGGASPCEITAVWYPEIVALPDADEGPADLKQEPMADKVTLVPNLPHAWPNARRMEITVTIAARETAQFWVEADWPDARAGK